jgi:hypothetical protein
MNLFDSEQAYIPLLDPLPMAPAFRSFSIALINLVILVLVVFKLATTAIG